MGQLNLPHGTNKKKERLKSKNEQSGESVESVLTKKGRLWWKDLQKRKVSTWNERVRGDG